MVDHEQSTNDQPFRFAFASLQSDVGHSYLAAAGLAIDLSTVVLIDETGVHTHSTAVLRVLRHCGHRVAWMHSIFIWLPAPLRDVGYRMVAALRYSVFGKDEGGGTCRRMSKAMRARFDVPSWVG